MHCHEAGQEHCAQPIAVSNCSASQAEGFSFALVKAAALRVMSAMSLKGVVFLEGGLVPWVVSGRDSGRRHGDVDF